jgi:hypothetical protein
LNDEVPAVKDNACAALARIILVAANSLPLTQVNDISSIQKKTIRTYNEKFRC